MRADRELSYLGHTHGPRRGSVKESMHTPSREAKLHTTIGCSARFRMRVGDPARLHRRVGSPARLHMRVGNPARLHMLVGGRARFHMPAGDSASARTPVVQNQAGRQGWKTAPALGKKVDAPCWRRSHRDDPPDSSRYVCAAEICEIPWAAHLYNPLVSCPSLSRPSLPSPTGQTETEPPNVRRTGQSCSRRR